MGSGKADYALCIRANIYPKEIISAIREHSKVCVNYQWDGIDRFPDIIEYLLYFDRCWVFNKNDVGKYPQHRFKATTNFYFDFPIEGNGKTEGLYFLGGYEAGREHQTSIFLDEARQLELPLDFYIYCKDDRASKIFGNDGITYLNRQSILSFEQNLQKVKNCLAVVDFVQFENYGLSFRVFDALCFDKKLITTNQAVAACDFFHPDNIFIWNGESLDGLEDFFRRPYHPVLEEIKNKYAFGNWVRRILDIPDEA